MITSVKSSSVVVSSLGAIDVVVQFSVQGGGGGSCLPGNGTSPALAREHRHRASREAAINFFMDSDLDCKC